jgi:hypothetical protein
MASTTTRSTRPPSCSTGSNRPAPAPARTPGSSICIGSVPRNCAPPKSVRRARCVCAPLAASARFSSCPGPAATSRMTASSRCRKPTPHPCCARGGFTPTRAVSCGTSFAAGIGPAASRKAEALQRIGERRAEQGMTEEKLPEIPADVSQGADPRRCKRTQQRVASPELHPPSAICRPLPTPACSSTTPPRCTPRDPRTRGSVTSILQRGVISILLLQKKVR